MERGDEELQRGLRRKLEKELRIVSSFSHAASLTSTSHSSQNSSIACSCVDCPSACASTKLEINGKSTFMIGNFNGYGVVAAIVIVVVTAAFTGFVSFRRYRYMKGTNDR